jgi:hypothetical protein
MLGLVAPVTMTVDQQSLWIVSAVDALQGIRAAEVEAISMEVRRSVNRPSQIVPKIAELVAARRAHKSWIAEHSAPVNALPPPPKHIAERDRKDFGPNDWAELNRWLESQGAKARYNSNGERYFIEKSTA